MSRSHVALVLIAGALLGAVASGQAPAVQSVTWLVDNLSRVGGHPVTVIGTPAVVETPLGPAVEFNGATDGLFLETNPLQGLRRFTVEALIQPAVEGPEEQRFFHVQDTAADNRALLELRLAPDRTWCLDTFLKQGAAGLTLIDRGRRHPAGSWHTVALSYDGTTMTHYVDGQQELAGAVAFGPMNDGRVSIGVRQNKVSGFKGRFRLVRITAVALPAGQLLSAPLKKGARPLFSAVDLRHAAQYTGRVNW